MSLKINRHIVRQNWMLADETIKLFKVLQGNLPEEEPQALFVGGCVRNAVMDRDVEDYDVATVLSPSSVVEILEAADIKVIPTGIDHGTVTAILGEYVYEITTLRCDKETDGRHAVVEYTDSWIEDAKRRDFTINTLLLDLKGNVYDPLGEGLSDIDKGKVRFVGDPKTRIKEDYLRILRFFRFSAIYSKGEFDQDGLKACNAESDQIKTLSKERITQEFFKIMASEEPENVLSVMFEHDILKMFKFDDYDADFLKHFCSFQSKYRLVSLSSRLLVLAALNLKNIQSMEEYVLFPKVFIKDMRGILDAVKLNDLSCDSAVREAVYRFGRVVTAQTLMIHLVQDRVMNSYAPKALNIIQKWDIPDFPISGEDLMKKGIKPGPKMGEELKRLEDEWIDNDFSMEEVV